MTAVADLWDVVVIGGGAAGLFAATEAAARGMRTALLEKNAQVGVKILMSGGTRCNLTHDATWREMAERFEPTTRQFLRTALARLTPQMVVDLIEREGVPTKVESTGKVFPASDRAVDVRDALLRRALRAGVAVHTQAAVVALTRDSADWVIATRPAVKRGSPGGEETSREWRCRAVILTSGGQSYPGCGTTGDGYAWVTALGHTVTPLKPALTPLVSETPWLRALRGITVERCRLALHDGKSNEPIADEQGALLFTHFGISGPAPMNLSRFVDEITREPRPRLAVNWAPSVDEKTLAEVFAAQRREHGQRLVSASVPFELPQRLWSALCEQAGVPADRRWSELTRDESRSLHRAVRQTDIVLHGTMGYRKAEVTSGGVSLAEVNPRTMESRLAPGLFLAGEILDIDGPIGGYNFQAAFSTGALAGECIPPSPAV